MLVLEITGYIGSDATQKEINGQKYISFTVAHSDSYTTNTGEKKESTTWISCLKKGESTLINYLKKGTLIFARGDLSVNLYDYKGMKNIGININVRELQLLSSRKKDEPIIKTEEKEDIPF